MTTLHLHADDFGLEDQDSIDDSLHGAKQVAVTTRDLLTQDVHAGWGHDLLAKSAVLDSAEADETGPADEFPGIEGCQLRRRLDHQNAGKQGPPGNVPGDPEFIVADVLISDEAMVFVIDVDDAVEHLHVAAVGIALADGFLVEDVPGEVEAGDVKKQLRRHGGNERQTIDQID